MHLTPTTPLPPVRDDITAVEYAPGMIVIYDEAGYATENVTLSIDMVEWLAELDGIRSALDLARMSAQSGEPFDSETFIAVVEVLESGGFLESDTYHGLRRQVDESFGRADYRPAVFSGQSYPSEPSELTAMLEQILTSVPDDLIPDEPPMAIVAPHIDLRVGGQSYGPAYRALARSDAETFVIFGTSHQMSYDTFMISSKDYETPLGMLPTDRELIEEFRSLLPFELTRDDRAHRQEHSIEFQALFIRHLFRDRDVRIVPILTGSLHQYVECGERNAEEDERLTNIYSALHEASRRLRRRVCYVAGADMSHIGRKFGDDCDAVEILAEAHTMDRMILECVERVDAGSFLSILAQNQNKYRVCGIAPIYATLRTARASYGCLLAYDTWDERSRGSAVTFASLALYAEQVR